MREALTQFYEIRESPGLKKKPSTSEALDWIEAAVAEDVDPATLRGAIRERPAQAARRAAEERAGRAPVRTAGIHCTAGRVITFDASGTP